MKKTDFFKVLTIEKEYNDIEKSWVFSFVFMFNNHTRGTGTINYFHRFDKKGVFTSEKFELDHFDNTSWIEFYALEPELRQAITDSALPLIQEIDAIEKKAHMPSVHFHELSLTNDSQYSIIHELTYSLGDSDKRGNIEVVISKSNKDSSAQIWMPHTLNSNPPGTVNFSAWQDYVLDQARKHSPLRIALLDI